MVDEGVVRSIVETYELPEKLEEKITWIAMTRLNEMFMNLFDDQYRYIAGLIDKFRAPYNERYWTNLDSTSSASNPRTLHETHGYEDRNLKGLTEDDHETKNLRISKALAILEQALEKPQYDFVVELLDAVNGDFNVELTHVSENIDAIRNRLEELAERYRRNGKIVMPRRPIKKVKFDPLSIVFRPRCYERNPIEFFEDNEDIYQGMSRTEMSRFDSGLYDALRRTNQLDIAIPGGVRT